MNRRNTDNELDGKINLHDDQAWTTRDGQVIPIGELEERHARNILRFLERNAWRLEFGYSLNFMMSLPEHMGDMTEWAVMSDMDRSAADPVAWVKSSPAYAAIQARLGDDEVVR